MISLAIQRFTLNKIKLIKYTFTYRIDKIYVKK